MRLSSLFSAALGVIATLAFMAQFNFINYAALPSAGNLPSSTFIPTALQNIQKCDLANTIAQRTVTIKAGEYEGSGMLLDGSYVFTANHVSEGHSFIRIFGSLNDNIQAKARVVANSPKLDLALLQINKTYNLAPLKVSPTTLVNTPTFAYSHRQNIYLQATLGQQEEDRKTIQDFPEQAVYGDSGTTLLNCAGEVSGNVVEIHYTCPNDPNHLKMYDSTCTFFNSLNVNAKAINAFLKKNWPNYTGQPFQSVNSPPTSRNATNG